MQIIKQRRIVDDTWLSLDDDQAVPEEGDIIVTLRRWQDDRGYLSERSGNVAVRLSGDVNISELVSDLARWKTIVLEFADFKDGRHYSNARLLRDRYGFTGEIRAVGDVQRDQLLFMERCGIDAYELRTQEELSSALESFAEYSVRYQPALDEPRHVFRQRQLAAEPVAG